jgi:hypothetical protein
MKIVCDDGDAAYEKYQSHALLMKEVVRNVRQRLEAGGSSLRHDRMGADQFSSSASIAR